MPQPISFSSPLPPGDLRFESMTHSASMNQLEEMQLQLLSPRSDIEPEKLLGRPVEVTIALRDGRTRTLSGYVTRFGLGRHRGRWFGYQATVRPWLWFLTRRADCRVFQNQTVKEIIETVFADHAAIARFEFNPYREYRKRDYAVQYRETDFNFVARLLEDEGIGWYFHHAPGEHKLVLVDGLAGHPVAPGCEHLPHVPMPNQAAPDTEYISDWTFSRSVQSGKATLASYDFERPSTRLLVDRGLPREHALTDYEVFDWQGDFVRQGDGLQLADNRIDEIHSEHEKLQGSTNAHGLCNGHLFTMQGHPRTDQNIEYLVIQAVLHAQAQAEETGSASGDLQCHFGAIPATQQFRPSRRTPKPFVQGPQTAVVVGPSGNELHTDKYGRVKVQFHWDRKGSHDERSSCWVRVSSPWAGKHFGFIQVPRIGQEVIVDFLEGDPDQPIVTGRVYNAEQMPPWTLPDTATKSGVLTRSSKGGAYGNANEISFEDKAGAELLNIHAELDMSRSVERDDSTSVGRDQSIGVKRDQSLSVTRNRSIAVSENETHTVTLAQSLKVGTNQENHIVGNQSTKVDGTHSLLVKGKLLTKTLAGRAEDTVGNESRHITGNESHTVGGNQIFSVTGALSYKAARMTFEAGHIEHIVTGANSVVHSSPNGPYSIMANKFSVLSNTDASILAVGKINQTSIENNVTVMGNNNSGYIGMSSETNLGLARSTFLGLGIDTFMGASISNTLALQFEAVLAAKLSVAAGPHLEMNSMKMYVPGGGGGGAGATVVGQGAEMLGILGALEGIMVGFHSAVIGFSELSDQYKDARAELNQAADDAAAEGHPGLAERLRRLAGGGDLSGREPTSTQEVNGPAPPAAVSSGGGGDFSGGGASSGPNFTPAGGSSAGPSSSSSSSSSPAGPNFTPGPNATPGTSGGSSGGGDGR